LLRSTIAQPSYDGLGFSPLRSSLPAALPRCARQDTDARFARKTESGSARKIFSSLLASLVGRGLTVNRLANRPIQRQQRILHILILQRPLQPRLIQRRLSQALDDDDCVADQCSDIGGYDQRIISTRVFVGFCGCSPLYQNPVRGALENSPMVYAQTILATNLRQRAFHLHLHATLTGRRKEQQVACGPNVVQIRSRHCCC
jgi:hypothetical protein